MQLQIRKANNGWITIRATDYPCMQYLYYTEREAIRRYREKYGLKGKHMKRVYVNWDLTYSVGGITQ